ncbi:MAG TPA: hypothetical protein RMH99_10460 [Sandaracinaceae bacterium LLY-WYZ-13_1]|nr:hypothetical protein [Sandaracinaceae bacterium LLY-WYZ-13_1]
MADERGEARSEAENPGEEEGKRPSGLPPAESTARRVANAGPRERLRPPRRRSEPPGDEDDAGPKAGSDPKDDAEPKADADPRDGAGPDGPAPARPPGLGANLTTSARLRLQLALDHDEDDEDDDEDDRAAANGEGRAATVPSAPKRPTGLKHVTTSARHRLQLALDEDIDELEAIRPPRLPEASRLSRRDVGHIPFDEEGQKVVRSLSRWVAFCGLLTLTVGALTGLSYVTGPGSVAHVVVGILACALSVWLLAAAFSFHRVLRDRRQQHHLVNGLGLLRSALLLKAILLFSGMVLGCFTFSIGAALLFLL